MAAELPMGGLLCTFSDLLNDGLDAFVDKASKPIRVARWHRELRSCADELCRDGLVATYYPVHGRRLVVAYWVEHFARRCC